MPNLNLIIQVSNNHAILKSKGNHIKAINAKITSSKQKIKQINRRNYKKMFKICYTYPLLTTTPNSLFKLKNNLILI